MPTVPRRKTQVPISLRNKRKTRTIWFFKTPKLRRSQIRKRRARRRSRRLDRMTVSRRSHPKRSLLLESLKMKEWNSKRSSLEWRLIDLSSYS